MERAAASVTVLKGDSTGVTFKANFPTDCYQPLTNQSATGSVLKGNDGARSKARAKLTYDFTKCHSTLKSDTETHLEVKDADVVMTERGGRKEKLSERKMGRTVSNRNFK